MKGDRFDNRVMALPHGNAGIADSGKTLVAAAIGTVVDLLQLPAGARVLDVKAIHGALNASTTLKVGYRFTNSDDGTDDDDGFLTAASSASAGRRDSAIAPLQFNATAPVIVTATVGGAEADGRVDVVVTYEDTGSL